MNVIDKICVSLLGRKANESPNVWMFDPAEIELHKAIALLMKSPTVRFADPSVSARDAAVRTVIDGCQRYMQLYHRELILRRDAERNKSAAPPT